MSSNELGVPRSTSALLAKAQRKMVARPLSPELIARLQRKANLARRERAERDLALALRVVPTETVPLPRTSGRAPSSRRSTRTVRSSDDGPDEPAPPLGGRRSLASFALRSCADYGCDVACVAGRTRGAEA
jgi:hypothetical protein